MSQKIFADFNNRDKDGFIRFNTIGTIEDLSKLSIQLKDGDRLIVSDGDLTAEVIVRSPGGEGVWRGEILSISSRE